MKKLFITLLLFCFYVAQGAHGAMIIQQFTSASGVTYVHDLGMEDTSAVSYAVANAGTGSDWTALAYPSAMTSSTHKEGSYSFYSDHGTERWYGATWTDERFEASMWLRFDNTNATGTKPLFGLHDGDTFIEVNEMYIQRISGSDEIRVAGEASATDCFLTSTNLNVTADTWFCLGMDIDVNASPYTVSMKYSTNVSTCEYTASGSWTTVTFGSWTCNPDAISAVSKAPWISASGTGLYGYVDGFRMRAL